jgi:ABC-2 type transport system permease protein
VAESAHLAGARRDLRVGSLLARARVRGELQYRTSFALFLVVQLLTTGTDLVAIVALFSKVETLAGWERADVVVLYGVSKSAFTLADVAFSPMGALAEWVRTGRFDRLLLRPAGAMAQLLGHEFQLRRLGRAPLPLAALVLGVAASGVPLGLCSLALLTLAVVASALLFVALIVLTACLAFWSPDSEEVASAFTYGGQTAAQYPTPAYDSWLRAWLLTVVPVGLTVYAPVRQVVGAPNPLHLAPWASVAGPLVSLPLAALAACTWRAGLRRYASTGS